MKWKWLFMNFEVWLYLFWSQRAMNFDGIPTKLNKNRLRYILPDSACTPKLMPYETRPSAALKKGIHENNRQWDSAVLYVYMWRRETFVFLLRHTRCISAIIMRKGVLHSTKILPLLYQTLYDIPILSFKYIRLLATLWVWIHYM